MIIRLLNNVLMKVYMGRGSFHILESLLDPHKQTTLPTKIHFHYLSMRVPLEDYHLTHMHPISWLRALCMSHRRPVALMLMHNRVARRHKKLGNDLRDLYSPVFILT